MKKERGGGESGVGGEVRGRAERNKTSWEEKDDVIGQEKFEDDKVEEKFGDDREWFEELKRLGLEGKVRTRKECGRKSM